MAAGGADVLPSTNPAAPALLLLLPPLRLLLLIVLFMYCLYCQVVAVYTDDGRRGHHMDDFIPKEELAKFMSKCGDNKLQQQVGMSLQCFLHILLTASSSVCASALPPLPMQRNVLVKPRLRVPT